MTKEFFLLIMFFGACTGSTWLFALGLGGAIAAPSAAVTTASVGAAAATATAFSAATLGVGAVLTWCVVGLFYAGSAARAAYNRGERMSVKKLLNETIFRTHDEQPSPGLMQSFLKVCYGVGGLLWSPFTILGYGLGKVVRNIVPPTQERNQKVRFTVELGNDFQEKSEFDITNPFMTNSRTNSDGSYNTPRQQIKTPENPPYSNGNQSQPLFPPKENSLPVSGTGMTLNHPYRPQFNPYGN